jgi:hypothetical protein
MVTAFAAWPDSRTGILVSSAGDDDDLVVPVTPDIEKGTLQVFVSTFSPPQRPTIGVERHFQDAVLTAHPHSLVSL